MCLRVRQVLDQANLNELFVGTCGFFCAKDEEVSFSRDCDNLSLAHDWSSY